MINYINHFFDSEWHKKIFLKGIDISLFLLIASFIGINIIPPYHLNLLQTIIHFYISIILIGRFNPLTSKKISFDKYDKRFTFSAGIALFLSTSFVHIFNNYINHKINDNDKINDNK